MFLCCGENSDSIELLARLPTWGGPASYLTTVARYTDRPLSHGPFQGGSNPGSTHFAPFTHAPANRVETGLDNRVRPTSEVGFDPVVSELEVS